MVVEQTEHHAVMDSSWILLLYVSLFFQISHSETLTLLFFINKRLIDPFHLKTKSTLRIICLACDKGFFGVDCNAKCPYPMYGEKCRSFCACNSSNCHHVNGCIYSMKGKLRN